MTRRSQTIPRMPRTYFYDKFSLDSRIWDNNTYNKGGERNIAYNGRFKLKIPYTIYDHHMCGLSPLHPMDSVNKPQTNVLFYNNNRLQSI